MSHDRLAASDCTNFPTAEHLRPLLAVCLFGLLNIAAWAAPVGQPSQGVLANYGHYQNVGGVIDRSVPHTSAAAAPDANASAAQFNRLADHNAFAALPEAASDPDGGPALYTVLQRAPATAAQVRPVAYRPAASPLTMRKPAASNKRFCTVTEVSRTVSSEGCR